MHRPFGDAGPFVPASAFTAGWLPYKRRLGRMYDDTNEPETWDAVVGICGFCEEPITDLDKWERFGDRKVHVACAEAVNAGAA